jgi:hypothetical protein
LTIYLSGQSSGLFLQTDSLNFLLLLVSHISFDLSTPRRVLCPHLAVHFLGNLTYLHACPSYYSIPKHMLYKHTTQKLYICDPQMQLKQLLYSSKKFTTCFGPYGPSSGDIFEDFLLYCDTSIIFTSVRLSIYCFLIYMYTMLRKYKIHNFLHRITQDAYTIFT